ncbi:MAG: pyridoxal-phosphate dependent enzyme [Candidatus Heimdallarchaeota archaeon]|nr:pyridoxal-phosphate dependent enzyme [Candidatus Heimdallarchaeota archaeon]MDH5645451.1 pyridoxal-phosphate dependent enzyme [Candidatus Heimdallarchaeota archaeon]
MIGFTLEELTLAVQRIESFIKPSPLRYSTWLSKELQAEVFLKLECVQPGGSFKIRGATNCLLSQKNPPKKIITASGGNHGLGVAIAARRQNIPCTVVLPLSTPNSKIELLKELGAEIELVGQAWDDANNYALDQANSSSVLYIHPFADVNVVLGQGTISSELLSELNEIDVVVGSVGGGGLLTGIALGFEVNQNAIEIHAVETLGTDSFHQSFQKGEIVELPAITSIANTLGAKKTVPLIFDDLSRLVSKSFVVPDKETVEAIDLFLDKEKLLVEPATSCIIASVLQNKKYYKDKRVVLVICGSNISLDDLKGWKKQFNL